MRLQAEQEAEHAELIHLDHLLAQRMQEEEKMTEQQKKRQAKVLESTKYYTKEDWDIIRANVESNTELSKILLGENEPGEDFATRMVNLLNQRKKIMENFLHIERSYLMIEIKAKYERLVRSIANFVPMGAEERVKRLGPELQSDSSKKQKTTEVKEVPVTVEPVKEPTTPKQEEIEQSIKKSGRQKSMARKRKLGQSMARKRKLGQSTAKEDKRKIIFGNLKRSGILLSLERLRRKFPLRKKSVVTELVLKLESEDDSYYGHLELIKFIQTKRYEEPAKEVRCPSYDSELLSEVPHYDTYHEDAILNDVVQESEYNDHVIFKDNSCDELTSKSNVISYVDYMVIIKNDTAQYVPPPEQDKNAMILSVIEQMKGQVEQCKTVNLEAKCVNESLSSEFELYKEKVKILEEK
ncbi:hypothetical protein Tco_0111399 [Tanacetum coccineum]